MSDRLPPVKSEAEELSCIQAMYGDLSRRYELLLKRADQLEADLAQARRICDSLAARCAGQSEALSKAAEKTK